MSKYCGQISKLITQLGDPISYQLPIGEQTINMNKLINKPISLSFDGEIRCIACNNKIKKTFMQGYCYPCFISSPQTSKCILKPELCRAHEGKARDLKWAKEHCLTDQYIYLSLTSNLKVGVTRHTQIPTRWIDQGAHKAIIFAKTPNRYLAGMIEKQMSQHISDKTYWRRMLLGEYPDLNLVDEKERLTNIIDNEYQQYITNDKTVTTLNYPISIKPSKIKSFNFDKEPLIQGTLSGIKGQYLFFVNDIVLNIRKYTGYVLTYKNDH